jgi:hypothetical protein
MDTKLDTKLKLSCLHCGGLRFWRVPAKDRHTSMAKDSLDVLIGRAGELLKDSWVDLYVCRACGVSFARVHDLERFAQVAALPESGVEAVEFARDRNPYR